MTKPNVVDLFSGVGGFSLGFEQAGFDVALAVDNHDITLETYDNNFPKTDTKLLDLSKADGEKILQGLSLERGCVDVIIGGPPCQGFSIMGHQDPDDKRNELLTTFGELIVEIVPDYFVMENVTGLLSNVGQRYLSEFIDITSSGEYDIIRPIRTLDAAQFGVPQNRERVIIIGYKRGKVEPSYPEPLSECNDVSDALSGIPDELSDSDIDDGVYTGEVTELSDYVKELNQWRDMPKKIEELSGLDPVSHTENVRERFKTVEPGKNDSVSGFHRLHPSGKSNTLRAGSGRDRGTHTPARPIHPSSPRCITVREAARLQSFPDWFEFHSTKYHGLRQIGNSVPPLLAKHIAEELIKHISE